MKPQHHSNIYETAEYGHFNNFIGWRTSAQVDAYQRVQRLNRYYKQTRDEYYLEERKFALDIVRNGRSTLIRSWDMPFSK